MKKKLKLKKSVIIFGICLIVFIFSAIKLGIFYFSLQKNKKDHTEIVEKYTKKVTDEETGEEVLKVDFDSLKKQNSDIVAWIRYNKDLVNYPVVQTKDNNYYLDHAFNKTNNEHGAIFMDYRNTSLDDQNVIIYGHNTIESRMFGSLNQVYNKDFFDNKNNYFIEVIDINNNIRKYEVFSYYEIEAEDYYITPAFNTTNEFQKFIDTLKKRSYKKFDVEVTTSDNILTLSTCHGGNKRTVFHGRLVK